MAQGQKATVEAECSSCSGTGVYRGFAEPKGVGVVCLNCDGEGKRTIEYKLFTGRKRCDGVQEVRRSAGSFIATGVGPAGESVTYEEFLAGTMPS